jgi:ketosteroid isomerase-like protein
MHRLPLLLILFISFNSSAQQTDSSIVSQLNRNWIASYATRDTVTMQQILADDFIMINPKGSKLSRTDVISNVGLKEISVTATIDSASVRIFGQTALVVAYTHFTIRSKDQTSQGSNCYSDLYIKRKGKWKAVAAHVTVLGMK